MTLTQISHFDKLLITMGKISFSCFGKLRYFSFSLAKSAAANQRKRRHYRSQAYKCSICGFYHIGSTIGRQNIRPRNQDVLHEAYY